MIMFFAKHPTAANLLMLLMVVLGLMAIPKLEKETFPDFTDEEVVITVVYPGATAIDIEESICRRIEEAVEGITFVDEVLSQASENVARVTVSMEEGSHFQKFMSDIKTEVESIDDFPDQAETPVIRSRGDKQPVVSVAIWGGLSTQELKAYGETLKERLLATGDVSLVSLQGFSQRQLRVEIPVKRLSALGLSPASLAAIISNQSLDLPAGLIETNAQSVLVRLSEARRTTQTLADLVVAASPNGGEVRLGDVATIEDTFELDEEKVIFNGQRAAMLVIEKTGREDALRVYDAVEAFLEEERAAQPHVNLTLTRDLTSITRDRLQMLSKNAWQGLLLVFFTLWLFFNVRLSFWVTVGLPVSFLAAFFTLPLLGMSINMITMVALLLALGLLMDDAIVIAENVATHVKRGESALHSVVAGVSEVRWGVLSSFLTTVAVFGPITMLQGNIGQVLKVMPVVLIVVLAFSLIEAFFILPNHLAHSLAHQHQTAEPRFRVWFNQRLEHVREHLLGRAVDWAVKHRWFSVGAAIGIFLISLAMVAGGVLKFQAFPNIEGDVVEAQLHLPDGTPLHRTEAVVNRLEEALRAATAPWQEGLPEGESLIRNIHIQYNAQLASGASGAHVAKMSVDLISAEKRGVKVDALLAAWREQMGQPTDVVSLIFTEPSLGPTGYPLEIRLLDDDLNQLKAAVTEMREWFESFQGVRDLQDDLHPGKPEIQVTPRAGSLSLGLTSAELARQIRAGYQGATAREVQKGRENYEVEVRLAKGDRNRLEGLETFQITMPNGAQAPLQAVARLDVAARSFGNLMRVDGKRVATLRGDVDRQKASVNELIATFQKEFVPQLKAAYPSVAVSIEGESAEGQKTGKSMGRGFLFGLLAIFLLLSFQFRSYKEPLIVMAAIPMSLVGVIWGHFLLGYPLTMPSMMGFVSLMGVVVNDSILLVIFIKNRIAEGASALEAVRGASRDRFRAVLLTSLTTIAGLLPLLAEQSQQAQILIPLAISLIFGLLASTVLVLILIPCLYAMTGVAHGLVDAHEESQVGMST